MYRELGRPTDAIGFHRLAVTMNRDLNDGWRLACALHNLAAALHDAGAEEEAIGHRSEAASLLARFSNRRASALRASIAAILGEGQGEDGGNS